MLLDELKSIVGPNDWTTDAAELEPHLVDQRGAMRGKTFVMVSPRTTADVSRILQACAREQVAVVPQGGNTGLCGGAIPDDTGEQVLLSLSRLNAIRSIEPNDFSITVEAGCVLATVQDAARAVGRYFPLSMAAEGSCQIGGNLSTNAGGINVIRYGTARQQVLGLEVVLADGTIWDGLRSLRKDTAGYDVKQLFLGSEGTLGIITAATLKLYPDPGETVTAFIALNSANQAVELLAWSREKLSDRIQAFELISDRALRFVIRHIPATVAPFEPSYPWFVLLEAATGDSSQLVEEVLAAALDRGLALDAIIAKNAKEAAGLWRLRHSISEAQRFEGASLKHDVSVPIGKLDEFLSRAEKLVVEKSPSARLVAFGHVGDGNLHYNVAQPKNADADEFRAAGRALTEAIYGLVTELGGSISAEHGIGTVKKADLLNYRSAPEIDLMNTVKQALDPQNILNPGKVI
jgi:FAD/FMN-containing dehydrogenase